MIARLDEIFDLQMGKTPSRNNNNYWTDGQYDWVSIADLGTYQKYVETTKEKISLSAVQESGIKSVPANTIIMSFKLSLGKTAITKKPVYTNEAIMAFIPTGKYTVLPDYFYYLFSAKDWTKGTNRAVMGITLNKATLCAVSLAVPPLDEQRKIAAVLDKVSDLIAKRRQQLDKLDELVKSQFIAMFGDPVQNPLSWDTKPLLEMGYCKNGMNFRTGDRGIEMHCLGVGDFKDFSVIDGTDNLPTISLNEAPPEESMLQDGDIVFVRSNGNKDLVGRCLVVYTHNTPTTYSGFCIRYRITGREVNTAYLLRVLKTDSMRRQMAGRGANIQNLNQQILATLDIPTPPLMIQEQFAAFVEQTDKSKLAIQKSLEKLEMLKKSLMQKYFG